MKQLSLIYLPIIANYQYVTLKGITVVTHKDVMKFLTQRERDKAKLFITDPTNINQRVSFCVWQQTQSEHAFRADDLGVQSARQGTLAGGKNETTCLKPLPCIMCIHRPSTRK